MANKSTLEQMLEHLVNDDQQKAEELFHEYVVAKSREIYENLIEAEMQDDEEEEGEDQKVKEADDPFATDDETDDLEDELDSDDMGGMDDMGDDEEMGEKSEEELFKELDDIVDELQSKFDSMKDGDESDDMGDMDDMDDMDDEQMKDRFEPELATVREYVEKVPAPSSKENVDFATSTVAKANKMGGQSMKFGEEAKEASKGTAGGLEKNKPQDMKSGNVNVPGGKAGGAFSKKESGHGAEKKGSAESADNTTSLFRGRRS
jgi:hypothetical protein